MNVYGHFSKLSGIITEMNDEIVVNNYLLLNIISLRLNA